MLRLYCDKCGARLSTGETAMRVRTGPLRATYGEIHLCEDHATELTQWLVDRPARPAGRAPAARKPARKPAGA